MGPDLPVNVAKSQVMNPITLVGVLPKIAEEIPNVRMLAMSALKDQFRERVNPENVIMKMLY